MNRRNIGVNQVRAVVESMNILISTFHNFIYFQVDSNLLFLYTHLQNTDPPFYTTQTLVQVVLKIIKIIMVHLKVDFRTINFN